MVEFILDMSRNLDQYLLARANRQMMMPKGANKRDDNLPEPLLRKISGGQVHLIMTLARMLSFHPDGVALKMLSKELDVNPASTSAMVERLVRKGLLIREHSEDDRRQIRINLSEKMETEFRHQRELMNSGILELTSSIEDDLLEKWFEVMEKIAELISKSEDNSLG